MKLYLDGVEIKSLGVGYVRQMFDTQPYLANSVEIELINGDSISLIVKPEKVTETEYRLNSHVLTIDSQ